jgi:hypothetical protein
MTKKNAGGFDSPGTPDPTAPVRSDDSATFESPGPEGAISMLAAESEAEQFLAQVDGQLLAAKAAIEALLMPGAGDGVSLQSADVMSANVVGVGIGVGDGVSAGVPGEPVLEVYTIEPEPVSDTRARLASAAGVSALSDSSVPVRTVHTGFIDIYPHRMRLRPAPGGISVAHTAVTAGTFGCLVRGNSAPRLNRLMVLSNNHVLANSNGASLGDSILQPGPFDGGKHPADQIAVLERFVPINFAAGASNQVDCATAWAWPDRVRKELMRLISGTPTFFRVGATPVAATLGLAVGKSGRTTQLTSGTVTAVGVTINVNYGAGRVGRFVNQIAVRAPSGDFSQGGDSGSLIWTWDARRAPVALLFAGGGGTTFGNPIATVLRALDVQIFA